MIVERLFALRRIAVPPENVDDPVAHDDALRRARIRRVGREDPRVAERGGRGLGAGEAAEAKQAGEHERGQARSAARDVDDG